MLTKKLRRVCPLVLAAILPALSFVGCSEQRTESHDAAIFTSFRDIPGVTAAEIAAIEELQNRREHFIYGGNFSTEAFYGEDGVVKGFTALFCEWLSQLFGITFIPRVVEWDELKEGLKNGTIDFTGELTANDERREKYFMTDDIVQRRIIYIRSHNNTPLKEIAHTRPLRYAFLEGATTVEDIRRHERNAFEVFFVDDYSEAYDMLARGEIDAFFDESTAEAAFDFYGEVSVNTFFPIIYSPVSMTTKNPQLEPIITVVQKALDNGAIHHLTMLCNQGHRDYQRHKLLLIFTDEEREYIRNNPVILFASEITNYPVSFYDSRTRQWEGIAHDVIQEIESLTGLTFKRQNDENTHWPELLGMLESGQVAMITELIPSEDRIGNFLWAGEVFFLNHSVLISKTEFRDIAINEILYVRTGIARNTAHATLFKSWFPNHRAIIEYPNTFEAFNALERGEVDVVMTSEHQLLIMINYREQVGYKANFVFDFYFDSTFGFNRNEVVLSSIVTKAMRMINIDNISGRWLRRTYDYRVRLAQERIPFMIGVGMLSVAFIFAVILFARKRKEGLRLETLVERRTQELSENQQKLLEAVEIAQEASRTKTAFLANMSHEIRTPMNAIIGMAEILEHDKLNPRQRGYVHDINISAHLLLGIINDILDMSKIEAGKLELNPVDYNFSQFTDNIVSMFTHVARNKGLEFVVETAGEIPDYLFGDDIRLRQILTNICGNAVKFTSEGYVKLSVSTGTDKLIFKIEDSGIGIRKEDLPMLFNAFEQANTAKNRNIVGTGLGLSICKSFVEMMGGDITVESEYGHGTAFIVSIPIKKGNAENIRKRETGDKGQSTSAPDARILVTDDNEFNLKVASGLLYFMEIVADTADSGARAIELVKQNDYDIVFMDHMMPEMDGIETVQEIRKLGGKYESVIIIALTANAVIGAREMFMQNGFNDFISKPIDADELQEVVHRYLPPDKVRTEYKNENQQAITEKEGQLRQKSIITFVKQNQNTFENICNSLSAGDFKTAHRIAHTLKSIAGYLGKIDLQEAASSLEHSLQGKTAEYTSEQLDAIGKELTSALREFEPLLKEAESEKPEAVRIDDEKLSALFAVLEPLLIKGEFCATNYVEELQGIAGMEELAERIDDYDFEGALKVLRSLKAAYS